MAAGDTTPESGTKFLSERENWEHFSGNVEFSDYTFHWEVNDFRVTIKPSEGFKALSDPLRAKDRAKLFNAIVMEVLKRSEHPDGSRSAAVAITESGQIFVSNNIQRQHEYFKDCAETNMVNILTQLVGADEKIAEMYLTIGRGKGDILCPCGKCMDTLHKASATGAMITILPINDGSLSIDLNTSAQNLSELNPGQSWKTTVNHFMPNATLALSPDAKNLALQGWNKLTGTAPGKPVLTRDDAERIWSSDPSTLKPDEQHILEVMKCAAMKAALGNIDGEAELEVDHTLKNINSFMVSRIDRAYRARALSQTADGQHEADTVRCVVVRLADGSFHSATQIESPQEYAVPHAEVTATAATRTDAQPITDVWVMEMKSGDILKMKSDTHDKGKMHTSPKEGLERIYKRRPLHEHNAVDNDGNPIEDNVNVHYISFNNGELAPEQVREVTTDFRMQDLFLSQWKGARFYRNGDSGGTPGSGMQH